jgi:hypothetical protein
MTVDERFERQLRAALVEQRPRNGAPAALREMVLAVPDSVRASSMPFRFLQAGVVPVSAFGITALALVLAAVGLTHAPINDLPGAGTGGVTGFDPSLTGMGLLAESASSIVIVGALLALLGGAVAIGVFFSPRSGTNRGRLYILVGLAGLAAGVGLVRLDIGLLGGNVGGAPLGYVPADSSMASGPAVYYELAQPGDPTVLIFSVHNTSALPVRIEGLVIPMHDGPTAEHWTALWLPPETEAQGAPGLDAIRPFAPFTLEPGALSTMYLAGRAGPCAFGPSFDASLAPGAQVDASAEFGPSLTIAYSVFGLSNTAEVDIGEKVVEPQRDNCVAFG